MIGMHQRICRAFVLTMTSLAGLTATASAQDERGWLKQDVAILVDVSASVIQQGWENQDKTVVRGVITGLREVDLGGHWAVETGVSYYESSMRDGSMPLLGPGNSLFIMRFGDLSTIRGSVMDFREIRDVERDTEDYLGVKYPTHSVTLGVNDFRDQKTNLDLAKATVYDMMDRAKGYYLIVVSDEDPDNNPKSDLTPEERTKIENWNSRSDDTDIVTLRRKGSDLKITLRAIGFNPDPDRPIRPVDIWDPPKPKLAIEFLGSLAQSTEESPHRPLTDPPYFAWQVKHDTELNRGFTVTLEPMEGQQPPPEVKPNAAFVVYRQAKLDGKYRVNVVDRSGGSEVAPPALPAYIEVKRRWDFLPYVAWVTGILSIGVFLYTWWTLRHG